MPTINQLIRKGGRKNKSKRVKASALRRSYNTNTTHQVKTFNPQKRGVCTVVKTMTLRSLTQRFVKLLVFASQTRWR